MKKARQTTNYVDDIGISTYVSAKQCDIRGVFVSGERYLPDPNGTLWCALVVIHNFELEITLKNIEISYLLFSNMTLQFWNDFLHIFWLNTIMHKMSHYQFCLTVWISHSAMNRMVWHYQG